MLSHLTTRGALAATTAVAAVALFLVLPDLRDARLPGTEPTLEEIGAGGQRRNAPTTVVDGSLTDDLGQASRTAEIQKYAAEPPRAVLGGEYREEAEADLADENSALTETAPAPAEPRAREQGLDALAGLSADAPKSMQAPTLRSSVENRAVGVIAPADPPPVVEEPDTEAFANAEANPVKVTAEDPVSTFSIDVDTASYTVIRSSLMSGRLPPREAVRIEEMVNYFPYAYPAPEADGRPFQPTVAVTGTPWNPDTQLLHVALQGRMPAVEDRPALNLVFLIDSSGSMQDANKLPLLKQSFRLMLSELRPEDEVAIVTYAGSAGRVLDATPAAERAKILAALDRLQAGGSTAGQAGLEQAYSTAEEMAADGEITRVILATDGDFNVGISDPEALEDFIAEKRETGTYLSVLGFGRGNLDDATMQALAQSGNGQAAYIDTLSEARKVLVDQLTGALFPIAGDVKIQIEFNPATVAEYRLIGYETRALRREDFSNDRVDAGEIGAGHAVTALYEITPAGSPAVLSQPLRYAAPEPAADVSDELAFLRLRYKEPGSSRSKLIELPILEDIGEIGTDTRFAAAIAGFGQLLKDGDYLGDWSYDDAIALANASLGDDRFGYRREAVTLMRLAESLSQ